MNRTFTPVVDSGTADRLADYAASFADCFQRSEQRRLAPAYLLGLLLDGERKSVEPMVGRIDGWDELGLKDPVQSVRHFVGHGSWDHRVVLARHRQLVLSALGSPQGVLIVDDSGNRKQGTHSVGVQRQFFGAAKEIANCQVAVTLHYASERGHCPLDGQLFLPESWTSNPARLDEGKVPPEYRRTLTKNEIALGLISRSLDEGISPFAVLADSAYGSSSEFRKRLAKLNLRFAVGVKSDTGVFVEEPHWDPPENRPRGKRGPGPTVPRLATDCRPVSVATAARNLRLRRCTWRVGTKGKMAGQFGRMWIWPSRRAENSKSVDDLEGPMWLVVEQRSNERKYYLANLPRTASIRQLVRLVKGRWPVEQGYQQLKEELGFDHFEGRRWAGFHHHMCLTFLAFGFLELERQRLVKRRRTAPKKPGAAGDLSPDLRRP